MIQLVLRLSLILWLTSTLGCPAVVIGDPATRSLITNDTDAPVEVELAMDKSRYVMEYPTKEETDEWLREFAQGEGVEVVSVDLSERIGRYRIAPSGFFVVHEGMGTQPYFAFEEITLTDGEHTLTLSEKAEIVERFKQGEGYQYEFKVSEAF